MRKAYPILLRRRVGYAGPSVAYRHHRVWQTDTRRDYPGQGFILSSGVWADNEREPRPGWEQIELRAAEMKYMTDDTMLMVGFARQRAEPNGQFLYEDGRPWHLEEWLFTSEEGLPA